MNTNSTEKPTKFYKYMSADGAINALRNETLKWSSPLCFNDPLDIPRRFAGDMRYTNMFSIMIKIVEESILQPHKLIDDLDPEFQGLIKDGRCKYGNEKRRYLNWIRKGKFMNMEGYNPNALEETRQDWDDFLPKMRILCLSARKDIVPMWFHYADKHRGVVLEFDTSVDMGPDNSWPTPHCMKYLKDTPKLFTERGWARMLMKPEEKAREEMEFFHTYVKKYDWKYEQEYRVARGEEADSSENYSYYILPKKSISSIYFGQEMGRQNRECLINLISKKKLQANIYDMKFEFGWKMVPVPVKDVKRRWLDLFKFNKHRKNCAS